MIQDKKKTESPFRDPRLSWQATGLLAFMLTHEENSSFTLSSLAEEKKKNTRAMRKILQELISSGYVDRQETRLDGRFSGVVYKLNPLIL